ncbi:MAG: hypothetical protein ACE5R6_14890 [Candidatus Heimdallarchaeota archaeon]
MRTTKNIRGLEFRLVLEDPFIEQYLRNKNPVELTDLGAGTNNEIAISFLDQTPQYFDGKQVIIYLVDMNPLWLSMLSQKLPKTNQKILLIQAELEQLTIEARIIESTVRVCSQKCLTPTIQTLMQQYRFPPACMDLVVFNRDMMGWLQYFNANTGRVLQETHKILKSDGLLAVTQPGLKYQHPHNLLENNGFTFVKRGVLQLDTGTLIESPDPIFKDPKLREYIYLVYQTHSNDR